MFLTNSARAVNAFDIFLTQREVLELEKKVFDLGVIQGQKESQILAELIDDYPSLEKSPKDKLRKALEETFRRMMASVMPVDISSIYEQTLVQHTHMYESIWSFCYKFGFHKEALQALSQKEVLLAVVSDQETLVVVEEEVVDTRLEYDFSRLKGDDLVNFRALLETIGLGDEFPQDGYVDFEELNVD